METMQRVRSSFKALPLGLKIRVVAGPLIFFGGIALGIFGYFYGSSHPMLSKEGMDGFGMMFAAGLIIIIGAWVFIDTD